MKIGILGNASPLTGIQLQRLIAESTPARSDQDHLEVICYTNPRIPDHRASLARDGGASYRDAIAESAQVLMRAGVSLIAVPSHALNGYIGEIQARIPVPLVDMMKLAMGHVRAHYGAAQIGLLAPSPVIAEQGYERAAADSGIHFIVPEIEAQEIVAKAVRDIKAGKDINVPALQKATKALVERGAKAVLLGCGELSVVAEELEKAGKPVVDPLRVLAEHLVDQARAV